MAEWHGEKFMKMFWGVSLILIVGVVPAWAALGEPESSVSADGQFMRAQIRDEVHEGYRLHQITDASGGVVREYVSPAGVVFGVSWQGPFVPNMQQLLGSYFTHLQQYAQAQTGHHGGPLIIQKDNFVFSSGGHMGWRHGHAYVPSLLPTNLSPEVVQ
jgi:hypothetical protein